LASDPTTVDPALQSLNFLEVALPRNSDEEEEETKNDSRNQDGVHLDAPFLKGMFHYYTLWD
jgi:hypothetical protein